jgi:hypothetical protein
MSQQKKPLTHSTQDAVNGLRVVQDALRLFAGENPTGGQANSTATRFLGHAISRLSWLDVQLTKAGRTCETCCFCKHELDPIDKDKLRFYCGNANAPSFMRAVNLRIDGCRRWSESAKVKR